MGVREKWKSAPVFNWGNKSFRESLVPFTYKTDTLQATPFWFVYETAGNLLDDIKKITSFTEKTKQQQQKPTFLTKYTEIYDKNKQKSATLVRPKHTGILRVSGQTFS